MAQPPTTQKAIPEDVTAWRNEVAGWRRFLKKSAGLRRRQGKEWLKGQRAYARRRLDDLLDNAPPSMVKSGEARQARVR